MAKASIVVGAGFGDEGKGITTDFLCRQDPTGTMVVRFSGGQQAGHAVKIGDQLHVHSNYGSGTLRGVPSLFSEHCTFYPYTIAKEREKLTERGIPNPLLYIHPLAKLTTPFDVAYGRVRERKLNHGSCGLGVGATMHRFNTTGFKLYAHDLKHKGVLEAKMKNLYHHYWDLLTDQDDRDAFDKEVWADDFLAAFARWEELFRIADYAILNRYEHLVFEGSQGIMLDAEHGIFPNVTYANTTSRNAFEIIKNHCPAVDQRAVFYVTRCYQTRHGNGWMSNDKKVELVNNKEEINVTNPWQGAFRTCEFDYDLLNHAISVDRLYSKYWQNHLVLTCLDQRPDFKFERSRVKNINGHVFEGHGPDSKNICGSLNAMCELQLT